MGTHKGATLTGSALAITVSFISKLWRSSYFNMLYLWSFFSPWNLDWMHRLYLSHLVHSSLLTYCSVLSVHVLSLLYSWIFCYVFITNVVTKHFCPDKLIDQLPGSWVWKAAMNFCKVRYVWIITWRKKANNFQIAKVQLQDFA